MIIGAVLLCGALSLWIYNINEDKAAGEASYAVLEQLNAEILKPVESTSSDGNISAPLEEDGPLPYLYDKSITEFFVDGNSYIGVLTLPTLEIQLPVMTNWSYSQLKIAPCTYSGSPKNDDFVIMAHNYEHHFGKLEDLKPGDEAYFTDMDGVVSQYAVEFVEVLQATAIEDMTSGEYALTLFTCTYGGQSRVAARLSRTILD